MYSHFTVFYFNSTNRLSCLRDLFVSRGIRNIAKSAHGQSQKPLEIVRYAITPNYFPMHMEVLMFFKVSRGKISKEYLGNSPPVKGDVGMNAKIADVSKS